MQLRNNGSRYGALALAAHWMTALLVVASWLLGTYGDLLPRGTPGQVGLIVHMCMGLTVLMISLSRLAWRLIDQQPMNAQVAMSHGVFTQPGSRVDGALARTF
jgi:cytochrome b561